ncbi:hypothetical protein B0H15DRAFT_947618 [Mycena belliarum]|uniref:Uncharacterized protein n=1 Tax=Mycena belliarum TaxID=1033014 RepID=A0AAD6UBV9_9AGAR|nr:hypothetical protein B0H15DRAFT_947618 [Mycena belliae]
MLPTTPQRVGIVRRCADEDAPTMEARRKGRTRGAVEEEVINGVIVKHYN